MFTPYLDRLLVDLLSNADLDSASLTVVTDLSPSSGVLDYRAQLLAIRRLLSQGIEVRSLPRLHAKVLVVDDRLITVGSQNFTSYARRSRETTSVPGDDSSATTFIETLTSWFDQATLIDPDHIDDLLSLLEEQIAASKAAHQELVDAYDQIAAESAAALQSRQAARRALHETERAREVPVALGLAGVIKGPTRYKPRSGTAYARLRDMGHYQTLMGDHEADLTTWTSPNPGRSNVLLGSYTFYPLILAPHGRMAFVRVQETRITYVWRGVIWGSPLRIEGRDIWVDASFPDRGLREANIKLAFRFGKEARDGYEVSLRFDGEEVLQTSARGTGRPAVSARLAQQCENVFNDEKLRHTVLQRVFNSLSATRSGAVDRDHAGTFFNPGWHTVDLVEFVDRKVLVATPLG